MDYHNHMRCTVMGNAVEKALSKRLLVLLQDNLDKIDPILWVGKSHISFALAYGKEFADPGNYAKGHGENVLNIFNSTFRV